MRKAQLSLMCCLLLCSGLVAGAQQIKAPKPQKQNSHAAIEREIREWLDSYAKDLRAGRRAALIDRYDTRGYFRVGNGIKAFLSFEEVKDRYLNKWAPPKSFTWKDLSIEVLSPKAVFVVGLFDLQLATDEMQTFSYSGLFIKDSGKWRIRAEDRSFSPLGYSTQLILSNPSAAGPFKYLLTAQPGASIAAHRHSVEMQILVRRGRKFILMGDLENAKVQVFEAGSRLVIPANAWHVEWWEAETVEEIEGVGPMKTEDATPATPRVP